MPMMNVLEERQVTGSCRVCSWIHDGGDENLFSQWLSVKCERDVGKDLVKPLDTFLIELFILN